MNAFPERSRVGRVVVHDAAGSAEYVTCWIHIDGAGGMVRIWSSAAGDEPDRVAPLERCTIEWHVIPPPAA